MPDFEKTRFRYKNIEFADDPGEWPCRVIPGKHSFLKKTSYAKDLKKYAKRFANRAVRRSGMNEVMKGCSYKRYWNYWKKYDLLSMVQERAAFLFQGMKKEDDRSILRG